MSIFFDKYPKSFLHASSSHEFPFEIYKYPSEFFTNFFSINNIHFSNEFKDFLTLGGSINFNHNIFKLYHDREIIFNYFRMRQFSEWEYTNPLEGIGYGLLDEVENLGVRIDDINKFLFIGSTVEAQPVLLGIAEPYLDEVYLVNLTNASWFADEPIRTDPDGFDVYPLHFVAPTFLEFIELLYKNSDSYIETNPR